MGSPDNNFVVNMPWPEGKRRTVQKKVEITGLKLLSLVKPACKAGPGLGSVNLGFKGVPVIPRTSKSGSLCLNCLYNNMFYAEHLLSFLESVILIRDSQRVHA